MRKKVLKATGFVFLFILVISAISHFSSPSRYVDSNIVYEGIGRVELNKGIYYGNLKGDMFTGEGVFEFLNGIKYAGSWEKSQMQGQGSCLYPEIGIYKGMYEGSMRSGEGFFAWDNGDSFIGIWAEDMMMEGTYRFADGSEYKGTFVSGKIGDGTFTYVMPSEESDIIQFIIELENGTVTGINLKTGTGFSYDGKLDNGSASIIYSDGNMYSGTVEHGIPNGNGTYLWMKDGTEIARYDGYWKQGIMNGDGIYYYTDNVYPNLKGTFENGIPIGSCTYTKELGKSFTAIWENGQCISVK